MLAWWRGEELVYAGNVGSGLDEAKIKALLPRLLAARRTKPAFSGAPKPPVRGTSYVEPGPVCEVRYGEITSAGVLRHPVLLEVLEDGDIESCVAPAEIVASGEELLQAGEAEEAAVEGEAAEGASASANGSRSAAEPSLELTRLDKIFWPVEGYTKGDLLAYYEAAWPWVSPYLRDRPLVLTRYPDGIEGKSFYQQNAPSFTPKWARHTEIDGTDFFVCNDLRTLLYVVNSGAIPLHVWSSRLDTIDRPDWLILDLDPKEAPFANVITLARHIHALLEKIGVAHYVKTSGQAGMHVLLPLGATVDHDDARALAEILARVVCAEKPEISTIVRPRAQRAGKVYVDYLQNGRGKLIAAPLSVRPRPHAPVSMPLAWSQVSSRLDPTRFTIKTALAGLAKRGDPLRGVLGPAINVERLLGQLEGRLAAAVAKGKPSSR
jgi:bifunctional non-homologous end joining protein LigD